jgi:hypothetical protein
VFPRHQKQEVISIDVTETVINDGILPYCKADVGEETHGPEI